MLIFKNFKYFFLKNWTPPSRGGGNKIYGTISKTVINNDHQKVVGWQANQSFAKDIIYKTPFEAILSINWIKGRLFVLKNLRKITTHSNFLLQTSYENVFGFKIENRENISSKYLNMTSLNYKALMNQRAYEFLDH